MAVMMQSRLAAEADMAAGKLNNEGVELERTGNLLAALDRYRAAIEINPFETSFRRNLALVLCRLERWTEGIAELEAVIEADPNDAAATRALYVALERVRAAKKQGSAKPRSNPKLN
jgi:tetratricopeptide (TPR) repeat protein